MNESYADVLEVPRELDWKLFGLALCAVKAKQSCSVKEVASAAGVSAATVSRASTGYKIELVSFLSLCIWMDANPFEFLTGKEPDGRELDVRASGDAKRCFTGIHH